MVVKISGCSVPKKRYSAVSVRPVTPSQVSGVRHADDSLIGELPVPVVRVDDRAAEPESEADAADVVPLGPGIASADTGIGLEDGLAEAEVGKVEVVEDVRHHAISVLKATGSAGEFKGIANAVNLIAAGVTLDFSPDAIAEAPSRCWLRRSSRS